MKGQGVEGVYRQSVGHGTGHCKGKGMIGTLCK